MGPFDLHSQCAGTGRARPSGGIAEMVFQQVGGKEAQRGARRACLCREQPTRPQDSPSGKGMDLQKQNPGAEVLQQQRLCRTFQNGSSRGHAPLLDHLRGEETNADAGLERFSSAFTVFRISDAAQAWPAMTSTPLGPQSSRRILRLTLSPPLSSPPSRLRPPALPPQLPGDLQASPGPVCAQTPGACPRGPSSARPITEVRHPENLLTEPFSLNCQQIGGSEWDAISLPSNGPLPARVPAPLRPPELSAPGWPHAVFILFN